MHVANDVAVCQVWRYFYNGRQLRSFCRDGQESDFFFLFWGYRLGYLSIIVCGLFFEPR